MRTLTDDVIAVLEDGGLTVGDGRGGELVDGTFTSFTAPFVVVYPLTQTRDGSLADAFSDIAKWFELIGQAETREQAEWVADEAESLLHASNLVVVAFTRSSVGRDDTTAGPPLFAAWCRTHIRSHFSTGA